MKSLDGKGRVLWLTFVVFILFPLFFPYDVFLDYPTTYLQNPHGKNRPDHLKGLLALGVLLLDVEILIAYFFGAEVITMIGIAVVREILAYLATFCEIKAW